MKTWLPVTALAIVNSVAMWGLYAKGHYTWLLALGVLNALNGALFNFLMIEYRNMMREYRTWFRAGVKVALLSESDPYSRAWEANPAQDASKPWRRES